MLLLYNLNLKDVTDIKGLTHLLHVSKKKQFTLHDYCKLSSSITDNYVTKVENRLNMVSFEVVTSLVKMKLAFIINRAEYHQTEFLRRIIIITYDSSATSQLSS